MHQLEVKISVLSPTVLSETENSAILTGSLDFFSGTILRGIFAGQYIKLRQSSTDVHNDPDFRQLFFEKLRFLPAFLEVNGKRSLPLPLSLMKNKNDGAICDFLIENPPKVPGYKPFRYFGSIAEDGTVTSVQVKKSISLHMSRSDVQAKQSGSSNEIGFERLAGKSSEGGIYNYEAVNEGQHFIAYILGEEAELRRLSELTVPEEKSFIAQIGRSKAVQYGRCHIELGEITPADTEINSISDTVYLRLDSPLIPWDSQAADAAAVLEETLLTPLRALTGNEFALPEEPMKLFATSSVIENFVGIWGMRRPRVQALKAGTVFALRKTNGNFSEADLAALSRLAGEGIGLRTEEGFGQLRGWTVRNNYKLPAPAGETALPPRQLSREASALAARLLNNRFLDRLRGIAADDAQSGDSIKSYTKEMTHAFARLDALLDAGKTAAGFRDELNNVLKAEDDENEKEKRTPFAKHLRQIKLNGTKLRPLLSGALTDIPQLSEKATDIRKELNTAGIKADLDPSCREKLCGLDSDEAFAAYWHWFFRYARKACSMQP